MASADFWKDQFKNVGRLTMLRNQVANESPTFQSGVVVTCQELANEDFSMTVGILPTLLNNMSSLSTNLTSAKTSIESTLSSYMTTQLKDDISATATTASGVINTLVTQMLADGVAISGAGLLDRMFQQVFGRNDLPKYYNMEGATTTRIWEGYATFDWKEWTGH